MPTLPWVRARDAAPASTTAAVVMTSRFRVRSFSQVPRFLLDSLRVRRQVLAAPGALGVSLVAHPLRREFLTLSAWRDRESLDALVRHDPHRAVMRRHRPAMAASTFVFWTVPVDRLPVPWDEAVQRLDAGRDAGTQA